MINSCKNVICFSTSTSSSRKQALSAKILSVLAKILPIPVKALYGSAEALLVPEQTISVPACSIETLSVPEQHYLFQQSQLQHYLLHLFYNTKCKTVNRTFVN
jgi:hypothetical protein